jgi:hypothetical protein
MTPSLQEDTEEPLAQRPTAAHQEASTADRKRRLSPPPPAAVQVQTSSSSSRSDPPPQKRRCLVDVDAAENEVWVSSPISKAY